MIRTIAIALVAIVAGVLGYAATRPDTFRIERSATIDAEPERIFALVDDFHGWRAWSPWETMDPAMRRTYGGAERGTGAVYEWEGDRTVGKGRMEITESVPPSRVTIRLDFVEPMEAHNVAEFTLEADGGSTKVTWAMYGPSPYVAKLMGLFVDMDGMVGTHFETGLANLKALAEK